MSEPLPSETVVEHVPVPRKALDDLHAALRFLAWAEAQDGHIAMTLAVDWLQSIGKDIFRD